MNETGGSIPAKILLYSTAAVVLTIGMREISSILTTIFFSIFAALIFLSPARWLKKKGVPSTLSVVIVIAVAILIVTILSFVVLGGAIEFGNQIPLYQDRLIAIINGLAPYIPSYEGLSVESILRNFVGVAVSFMIGVLNGLLNTGTTVGIILLTAAFLLIDAVNIPEKVREETKHKTELQVRLSRFGKSILDFILVRTETSLFESVLFTILFLLGGIDFAILWGVVIFLLSYIPYIGLVLGVIPPAVLAFFQYGPLGLLGVIVGVIIVDAVSENLIFPSLAKKGLNLSPAVLFLTLLYWNYVLGPSGVLLSVPLTIFVKFVLESFEETRWIARLMGPAEEIEYYKKDEEPAD
ncbi:MAG: AI-2E family transporter [Methanosarcina sp.]